MKKLNYKQVLKFLSKNGDIRLVQFSIFDGELRNNDGEVVGSVSSRVMDKIANCVFFTYLGNGDGILSHERYYKLK